MIGIATKFISASNTKGSRVKAWTDTGTFFSDGKKASLTLGYDHAKNSNANHEDVALAFAAKLFKVPESDVVLSEGIYLGFSGIAYVFGAYAKR